MTEIILIKQINTLHALTSFTLFGVAQTDEVFAFDVELKLRSTRCGFDGVASSS